MDTDKIKKLLSQVSQGNLSVDTALDELRELPYKDLGYAKLDHHRHLRSGFPEVIYCPGKTTEQITNIFAELIKKNAVVLATRADAATFAKVFETCSDANYHELARCITFGGPIRPQKKGTVLVISAGTADLPVAEEAAVVAELMGNPVERIFDVGVAGLHRLLDKLPRLQEAAVLIVVAGMEGALPSVVAGLVERPVIAVPTSIGYGANFGGLAPLLAMLNSCASGIGVVNIDNGFGAAVLANSINLLGGVAE